MTINVDDNGNTLNKGDLKQNLNLLIISTRLVEIISKLRFCSI